MLSIVNDDSDVDDDDVDDDDVDDNDDVHLFRLRTKTLPVLP